MYSWLLLSHDKNENMRLKCDLCSRYNIKNVWVSDGTPNIQKSSIERHSLSVEHAKACKLSLQDKCANSNLEDSDGSADQAELTDPEKCLIRTVYTLMKNDILLEKVNAILELQHCNGLKIEYQNLSWTTVTDIRDCIANVLMKTLIEKINKSEYYAILIDETTDITVTKRLSICVRYFHGGTAETSFLGNVELPDGRAHTLTAALQKFLEEAGIDMSKCVSLATDGASVMMGQKSGVGVQIKSKFFLFISQTHCVAHRLNLAVTDSIKEIDVPKNFRDKFANLYNFMVGSGNRVYTLKKMQELLEEPEITIKEPHSIIHSVAWSEASSGSCLRIVRVPSCYIVQDGNVASENSTAKGLYKYFSTYKTALLLGLMVDIHTELTILSCQLQEKNLIFSHVTSLIDSTVGKLEILKMQDGLGLAGMKASFIVMDEKAFYKTEELKAYGTAAESQFENVRTEYLNNLIKNIRRRIRKHASEVLKCLSEIFQPSTALNMSKDDINTTLQVLWEQYGSEKTVTLVEGDLLSGTSETVTVVKPLIHKEQLSKEWLSLRGMMKGSYREYSLSKLYQSVILNHSNLLPNMSRLAKIALCIEVTSVECERSFNTQNRIKPMFRSSLKEKGLQSLMLTCMLGPDCKHFNPRETTQLWLSVNSRQKKKD